MQLGAIIGAALGLVYAAVASIIMERWQRAQFGLLGMAERERLNMRRIAGMSDGAKSVTHKEYIAMFIAAPMIMASVGAVVGLLLGWIF